jgi:HEXXH motif-containing protein
LSIAVSLDRPWLLATNSAALALPFDNGRQLSERLHDQTSDVVDTIRLHGLEPLALASAPFAPSIVDGASRLIGIDPELHRIVGCCAREISILATPGDAYDISHSTPLWPTRILISIPAPSAIAHVRVAEAIVHEAMHLNLTFFESEVALVACDVSLYSPWKDDPRPASGVLHGLYVFGCLCCFFRILLRTAFVDANVKCHVERRLFDIRSECKSIDAKRLLGCLTPDGKALVHRLFSITDFIGYK